MSKELDLSRKLADEGNYKKAVRVLWRVEFHARTDAVEAEGLRELATTLRDKTSGTTREHCDLLIKHAEASLGLTNYPPVVRQHVEQQGGDNGGSKKQGERAALLFLCCALLTSGAAIYCAWAMPCTGGSADDSPYVNAFLVLMVAAAVLWMLTVLALAVSIIGLNTPGCGSAIAYLFAILFAVVVVLPFSGIVIWVFMDTLC